MKSLVAFVKILMDLIQKVIPKTLFKEHCCGKQKDGWGS
jgi:hypothetical protein